MAPNYVSHRDTAIIMLKMEVDELLLSVMEEIRLLVALCSNVMHLILKQEVVHVTLSILFRPPQYALETQSRINLCIKDEQLKNTLISYLSITSDFTEAKFTRALSPAIPTPMHEECPARFIATVPTIGDPIETLDDQCTQAHHGVDNIRGTSPDGP
ncbi:hypothetical protein BN946_scf184943.g59 [Trametes cinnabarina]|uniref:Uncharacterized protein n=1 Tax=Pycnoporus cinnabarinus TaxID=5643 RepID=A0A060SIG8_PYCCI|nr:hypothetical protein BN946_scf184943.g59 [Trametes cinnabarina]